MFKHALTHDVAYESVAARPPHGAAPAPSAAPSRSSTPTAWPSTTRPWRTTSAAARTGSARCAITSARPRRRPQTMPTARSSSTAAQALAIADRLGDAAPTSRARRLNERLGAGVLLPQRVRRLGRRLRRSAARSAEAEARALHLGAGRLQPLLGASLRARRAAASTRRWRCRDRRAVARRRGAWRWRSHGFYRGRARCRRRRLRALQSQRALDIGARHAARAGRGVRRVPARDGRRVDAATTRDADRARAAGASRWGASCGCPKSSSSPPGSSARRAAASATTAAPSRCSRKPTSSAIGSATAPGRAACSTRSAGASPRSAASSARATYNERAAALAREIGDPEILANADINLALEPPRARRRRAGAGALLDPIEDALAAAGRPVDALALRAARAATRAAASSWRAATPERALAPRPTTSSAGARPSPGPEGRGARAGAARGQALLALDRRDEAEVACARRSDRRTDRLPARALVTRTGCSPTTPAAAARQPTPRCMRPPHAGPRSCARARCPTRRCAAV